LLEDPPENHETVEVLVDGSMSPEMAPQLSATAPLSRRGMGEGTSELRRRVEETYGLIMRAEFLEGVINLSTGDPLTPPPAAVRDAYFQLGRRLVFDDQVNPDSTGSYLQRESEGIELHRYRVFPIAARSLLRSAYTYFRENGIPVSMGRAIDPRQQEILAGIGTTHLCVAAMHAICDPGDSVLTPRPCYGLFGNLVGAMGASLRLVDSNPENDYKMGPDDLDQALRQHESARCLLISNPGNPTGSVYSREEYEALAEVLERPEHSHVWVLLDEVYDRTILDPASKMVSFAALPRMYQRTVTVSGVAKNLGLAKLRMGFACGPSQVIWSMTNYIIATLGSVPEIDQEIAAQALASTPASYFADNNERCRRNLEHLTARVEAMDARVRRQWGVEGSCVAVTNVPKAGFFVCISFPGLVGRNAPDGQALEDDFDLFDFLASEARVTGVPGSSHGFPANEMVLRFSFAVPASTLEEALNRIEQALLELS
jgi:aspartate aminotransferase